MSSIILILFLSKMIFITNNQVIDNLEIALFYREFEAHYVGKTNVGGFQR